MATVYLAHDLKHDRKVAIKVLKPELAAVLGAERFVRRSRRRRRCSIRTSCRCSTRATADGFLFYVMPYVEGETLREKLNRETQLGVDEAVRIAREVADALDYAHRHGVIHRDIKPENILLHDGRPMVADFGIALAVERRGRRAHDGDGPLARHAALHVARAGDRREGDHGRSDIYSLGVGAVRDARRRSAAHGRVGAADHHEDHRRAGRSR